jgi:ABC-type antimicrobial peptide transport system permease subunit
MYRYAIEPGPAEPRADAAVHANVQTLHDVYDKSLARTSFTLVVLGVARIYGVISYSVSQRGREIGIRIALGAQARRVTTMFVRHGLVLSAIGVAIGLTVAFAIMQLMSSFLFEISPIDPLTYAVVSLTLMAATVLASYVPALRATAVDPIEALRAE